MKNVLNTLVLMAIGSTLAFGQTETLSWQDIYAGIQNHELVQQARINLAIKTGTLEAETGWKSPQLTLTPSIDFDDATGEVALAETAIGAGLLIPLGLSEAERERKIQAREVADIAVTELRDSYGKAYTELYSLFGAAYTAQGAIAVAETELELARLTLESVRQKTALGILAISDLTDAETDYQAASEKIIQSGLDARIAWFNLSYSAGLDAAKPGQGRRTTDQQTSPESVIFDLPRFQAPVEEEIIRQLPQPGVLMTMAKETSPLVLAQKQKIETARRSLDAQAALDVNLTPRILYATPGFSSSLGYGTATGALTLGTDWKAWEKLADTTKSPDNSLTISVGISGNFNPVNDAQRRTLLGSIQLEERRLAAIEQVLELQIRSKYAAYLKAKDSLAQAERGVKLSGEIDAVNKTRRLLGQLAPEDEAANQVQLVRASFALEKAKTDLSQAYLGMIASAGAWDAAGISLNGVKQ